MSSKSLSVLALAAAALAAPLDERATCAPAHILWARGSYESYQNSSVLPFVNLIQGDLGASVSPIIYPATVFATPEPDSSNIQSVNAGIANTVQQIKDKVAQCGAKSNIVLVGGSQGGQVMTDTLVGGAGQSGNIDPSYWKYISATVVFGDPTFTYPSSYAAGNATTSGAYQRYQTDTSEIALNTTFANTLRSYCTQFDPICSGLEWQYVQAHVQEVSDHTAAARAFILHLFGK